jgi:hypothetical protein
MNDGESGEWKNAARNNKGNIQPFRHFLSFLERQKCVTTLQWHHRYQ